MKKLVITLAILMTFPFLVTAETENQHYRGQGYVITGLGTATGGYSHPFIVHFAGGGEGFLYKGLGIGGEAGIANYADTYSSTRSNAVVASGDFSYHFGRRKARGVDAFLLAGPSFIGPAQGRGRGSVAANFGGGTNLWLS
jgi:hypothetical protein